MVGIDRVVAALRKASGWSLLRRLVGYWWVVVPTIIVGALVVRGPLSLDLGANIYISEDSALFYYSGRQWVEAGRVPYRHLWDLKPPLIHEIGAVLALATGGDSVAMHALGVAVNTATLVSSILGLTLLVRRITDSQLAGFATGTSFLAFPYLFGALTKGLQAKYPFALCLTLVLVMGFEERWLEAAAAAALAASLWQPGLLPVFLVLGTVEWYKRTGYLGVSASNRAGAAVLGVAALVVSPIVLGNAVPEMLVQAVAAPLITADGGAGLQTVLFQTHPMLAIVGLVGATGFGVRSVHPVRWWPLILVVGFGLLAVWGDLDGVPDLIPLSILLAFSTGLAVGVARPPRSRPMLSDARLWLVILVVGAVALADPPTFAAGENADVARLFLRGEIRPRCHIRYSSAERQMMGVADTPINAFGRSTVNQCWRPAWWPW
ncbi:MAG: DolP-mannose mannosyltransferase [Halorhabdus sp.]